MASQVEAIKWIPGTDFIVDGFAFQSPRCRHYFLTHFHSDHTIGLTKSFRGGVIYCSPVTARLLIHDMGVRREVVKPLAVGVPVVIDGVRVTPLDANHCPGSVMFLFEVPTTRPASAAAGGPPPCPPAAATSCDLELAVRPALGLRSSSSLELSAGAIPPSPPPSQGHDQQGCFMSAASSAGARRGQLAGGAECEPCRASGGGDEDGESGRSSSRSRSHGTSAAWSPSCEPLDCGTDKASTDGQGCERLGSDTFGVGALSTHNILHTGDCRWQPWMRQQPGLAGVRVDTLFLDTTYAAPKHTLPPQEDAVSVMVQVMRDALVEEPKTVFVVAAYHIGKERAFLGAAQQLGAKVWCSPAKLAVLRLLDLPKELTALLVEEPREAAVHVAGWGLRPEDLQEYLDSFPGVWKRAMGIRPTGWTLRRSGGVSVRREGNVAVVGVPYSEHSSWTDLCTAVADLRPRRLVPTVNAASPTQRRALVDRFAHLMDLSADRSRLDLYLSRAARVGSAGSDAVPVLPSSAKPLPPSPPPLQSGSGAAAVCCRVDLTAVDVAEQQRILSELERRHTLRQQQQSHSGSRTVKAAAATKRKQGQGTGFAEAGGGGTAGVKRARGSLGQEAPQSRTAAAAGTFTASAPESLSCAPAEGQCEDGRSQNSELPPGPLLESRRRVLGLSTPRGRPDSAAEPPQPLTVSVLETTSDVKDNASEGARRLADPCTMLPSSLGKGRGVRQVDCPHACIIDLTADEGDEDGDRDDGGVSAALGGAASVALMLVRRKVDSGVTRLVGAAAGRQSAMALGQPCTGACQVSPAPSAPAVQRTLWRYMVPVRRVAAAVL